jgi:hypothetical protein
VSAWLEGRRAGASGQRLALLIAVGIGLHNLGEGVAIGSSYAVGALALGAFLVVGFAIHNTTEGLAIVAPVADARPTLARLAVLGLIAGAQFDVLSRLQALPQIPLDAQTLTTGGVISALAVAVVSLIAAILGGLTGMRYHRKIDRVADDL